MMQPPQGLGIGAATEQPAPAGEDQPNVSPEDQAQYDQFMNNAYELITADGASDELLKTMEQGQQGLATAAVRVVSRVEESARENGINPTDDVLFAAGVEVIEALATLSENGGGKAFSEKEIEGALYQALDQYREEKGDAVDMDGNKQALAQLTQADQAGQLGQILPGVE